MTTPDGWRVELVGFDPAPRFRVSCGGPAARGRGVVVSLDELVSVLGDSFELLAEAALAGSAAGVGA
jgi:hypothetical protein